MKLEDIHSMWASDAVIDDTALDTTSREIPRLHSKYLRHLSTERIILKHLESDLQVLKQAKADRLSGAMSQEELKTRGWEPERRKYLKGEIDIVLQTDPDIISLNLRIAIQQEKVEALDSIIKHINSRNFIIKSIIDWKKFISGSN